MSFMDDLNKFVHNYPYTNYHELVLNFLSNQVAELQKKYDELDLEGMKRDIETLLGNVEDINSHLSDLDDKDEEFEDAISNIRGTLTSMQEAIRTNTDNISDMQDDIDNLASLTSSLEGRVTNLENAAFGEVTVNPIPRTFTIDLRNAANRNIDIRYASNDLPVSGIDTDAILLVDGGRYTAAGSETQPNQPLNTLFKMFAFQRTGTPCYINIPNIYPYRYGNYRVVNPTLYIYAQRNIGTSDTTAPTEIMTTTLNALIGGVKAATASGWYFNDIQLVLNQETGWYDLRLYNGRDDIFVTSSDIRYSSMIISEMPIFPAGTSETLRRSLYYSAYNSSERQAEGMADVKVRDAKRYTNERIATIYNQIIIDMDDIAGRDLLLDDAEVLAISGTLENNNSIYNRHDITNLSADYDYVVTKIVVQFSITGVQVQAGTAITLAHFNGIPLGMAHMLSFDIRGQSGATAYGNITNTGDVTMTTSQAGTFSVRVHGWVYDLIKVPK